MSDSNLPPDLNLLAALAVLLQERSLTRAAERLGVSQSAMSHKLRALREHFSDPLLVRNAGEMILSERAQRLVEPLAAALDGLRAAVSAGAAFDPRTTARRFTIACSDFAEFLVLPRLATWVAADAPAIELDVAPLPRGDALVDALGRGDIDVAMVGPHAPDRAALRRRVLPVDGFVVIAHAHHPRVRAPLSLEAYLAEAHVLIAPGGGPHGVADDWLHANGHQRRIVARPRHFLSAPFMVAQSELLATVPMTLAADCLDLMPLQWLEPPMPLPGVAGQMVWHERSHNDAGHTWLRQRIADGAQALDAAARARFEH